MLAHRVTGGVLAALGLTLLALQLALLYGSAREQAFMVSIGLPGTAVMSALGAVSFSVGCLLMAAPRTATRHLGRAAALMRRAPRT